MTASARVIIYRILVALNMPPKVNDWLTFAGGIHFKMSNNDRFVSLATRIALFLTKITALRTAQEGRSTTPATVSVEVRDLAFEEAKAVLRLLGGDVQEMADLDIPNARIIITDAGMEVKEIAIHERTTNVAFDGPTEGTATAIADGQGGKNWRVRVNSGSFVGLVASDTTTRHLSGYAGGDTLIIQYCEITKNGEPSEWSEDIKIILKKY